MKSGLRCLGGDLPPGIGLHQETLEILTLHFIREEIDRLGITCLPAQGVIRTDHMNLSKSEESENGVDQGGDCRQRKGRERG